MPLLAQKKAELDILYLSAPPSPPLFTILTSMFKTFTESMLTILWSIIKDQYSVP